MEYRFIDLLKKAIGNERTQKQFAAEAGISAEHLNRMIKQTASHKPAVVTLEKIADHSEGRVTVAALKKSLGMELTPFDEKADLDTVDYKRRNALIAGDMKTSVLELSMRTPHRYSSIEDMLDMLVLLCGWSETTYRIEREEVYQNQTVSRNGAENYACITVTWNCSDCRCDLAFVLYYCYTAGNGVIITDAAFDLVSLCREKHPLAEEVQFGMLTREDSEPQDIPLVYVCTLHDTKNGIKNIECTDFDKYAELLLNAAADKNELAVAEKLIKRVREC